MDMEKFREIEEKYRSLKEKLEKNEISPEELKVSMKKMMIHDKDGNYWMIGSNTGKWYLYNGTDWKEKSPYSNIDLSQTQHFSTEESQKEETVFLQQEEKTDSTIEQHEEREEFTFDSNSSSEISLEQKSDKNTELLEQKDEEEQLVIEKVEKEEDEEQIVIEKVEEKEEEQIVLDKVEKEEEVVSLSEDGEVNCIICKSRLDSHSIYCNFCGANQKELSSKKKRGADEMVITSIRMTSLLFFLGGLGLIFGVILGATFGVFEIFGDMIYKFPEMLSETRGKVQGGLIFAAIGGIGGFVVFSLFSVAITLIYNTISYLFGGIRIKTQ